MSSSSTREYDQLSTVNTVAENNVPGKRRLPPFLDHFNGRDLKILFRCWLGAWVACLLMVIPASVRALGQATFFACMVHFMNPPSGIVFVYLLGAFTVVLGMLLAWGWGAIVMKAALAARPAAETQARLQSLQQLAAIQANQTGISPDAAAQQLIFDGYMLDTRVTVVTYCLMCLFMYLLARVRASNPKLTLTQVYGTIIGDIFLCYIPVLPSFWGTLPLALIEPALAGVGLGLASCVLFFPRSTSHVVLASMVDILALLKIPLELTSLTMAKDSDKLDLAQLRMIRSKILGTYQQMGPALAFLPLDFSVGCWDARDVGGLKDPVRKVLSTLLSLLEFQISRVHGEIRNKNILEKDHEMKELEKRSETTPEKGAKGGSHTVARHHISQVAEMLDGLSAPDTHPVPDEVAEALYTVAKDAISSCLEGLTAARECIHMVNSRRWRPPSAAEREQVYARSQAALERLRSTRASFVSDASDSLLHLYAPLLEETASSKLTWDTGRQLRGFVLCMVFEEHLSNAIIHIETLLDEVSTRFHTSTKTRLTVPAGLRYAVSWATGKKSDAPAVDNTADPNPDDAEDATKAAQEKLRMSRKYRVRQRSGLGRAILGVYHWFTCPEGMYALRLTVVTIALSIPGVIHSSAGFFYREKGLWALIMSQTGLLVYMADFTWSVITRVVATVIGGVLGVLAWYIGSAKGPGNPYGLAAIMAVILVGLVWARLWMPPSLRAAGIMGGVTFLLTIGYSFSDTHIPQYGDPGVGYSVFWRRLVLVIVGVVGALIVQMFPSPPSTAHHICKTLSNTIRGLSDHYALMLSCWGHAGDDTGRVLAEPITLRLAETLVMLDGPIQLLRFEFSSSRFDSTSLEQVKTLCHTINRELGRLLYLSASLPVEFQKQIARQVGVLDDRNIGEIMAVLGVCEQAMKTGDAPPEMLPTPLVRRAMGYWQRHQTELIFSKELVRDEHYRRFCVALNSYIKFLDAVDDLVLVLKSALGESHLVSKDSGAFV